MLGKSAKFLLTVKLQWSRASVASGAGDVNQNVTDFRLDVPS